MKEEKENSIDKLFSQGLSEPGDNASYREEDWDAMEAMLDGKKPKGITRSLILLVSTIAAMLLLVIGWLFLNPVSKPDKTTQVVKKTAPVQKDSGKYGPPVQQLADLKSNTLSANDSSAMNAGDMSRKSKSFFTLSAVPGGRKITGIDTYGVNTSYITKTPGVVTDNAANNIVDNVTKHDTAITDKAANYAKVDTIITDKTAVMASNSNQADTLKKRELVSVMDDVKPNKKPAKYRHSASGGAAMAFKPTLALSFVASPDVNSVKGFSQKVGTNAGLLLTVGVTRKWSITTGAIYADKPYLANFANYTSAYKFSSNPESVSASCTVLDIPINVGYQVYNKGVNKFSMGTGLSSYFMLRENYTFNYAGGYPGGPATYNIRNKNQHIMGILNLNMTYQREISSKFGVAVQPYYKVPLTGIGYGQVNLKSAGVAVGVTWNINPGTKP
ncbi:hypothetical protein IDJ75_12090 [Mucilaginibacter rigui]|uniref:Outer membrane protein beta-barrel domain-containing protein n=1 Tax=Mucilaginibacter rigui TaxID=534635 RepID=A0ABR7X621_9SPHI|nr:hypothetical protein [Mucilaginibacter rigui]MBD1386024.1 hypothetical protein [Mucilaginibacter rigui]